MNFNSMDEFLGALSHVLIKYGVKSNKVDPFLEAALGNPEWEKLAVIMIDLRTAYEEYHSGKENAFEELAEKLESKFGKTDTMEERCINKELWREYDFGGRTYRINDPIRLFYRSGGTTHRVLDVYGVVHCCPAPGHKGCVLRWQPKEGSDPVQF